MTRSWAAMVALGLGIALARPASAGTLVISSPAFDRGSKQTFEYRLNHPVTGRGTMSVRWTDAVGRLVEESIRPVDVVGSDRIPVPVDLGRAVATVNQLQLRLAIDCPKGDCPGPRLDDEAEASFITVPPDTGWWDYQIIMWQPQSMAAYAALRRIGVSAGAFFVKEHPPNIGEGALLSQGLAWYAENLATDFFSAYHRYFPDKPVNWRYIRLQEEHQKERSSLAPFQRDPSLADPAWRRRIDDRLRAVVEAQDAFHPLYYSLGDETGIADLAAYWDFDFSPSSLDGFRHWLRKRYGGLDRLNRQWASRFASWNAVTPPTAAQTAARRDDNFSAWCDFREWMDVSFAGALAEARDAVHAVDPHALAAIEGGQVPGWGGYDYSRLVTAVDAFELYDKGDNIQLVRSLNPAAPILTTSFRGGPEETLRVWRELLHGTRGLILWDDRHQIISADGALGPRGSEAAPLYTELRRGIAALLINSRPLPAQIAVHYSPDSFRVNWMLDQRRLGEAGIDKASFADHPDDDFTRTRLSLCDAMADLGAPYGFISSRQIEGGALSSGGYRLLILPRSTALSMAEAKAIRRFVRNGGTALAVGEAGRFDEHGRRRVRPILNDVGRLEADPGEAPRELADHLRNAGIIPPFKLRDAATGEVATGVEVTVLRNGGVTLLGLLRTAAEARHGTQARDLIVELSGLPTVYDLRAGRSFDEQGAVTVTLPAVEPVLLALAPRPIPDFTITAPANLRRGDDGRIRIARLSAGPDAVQIFHVEVRDPAGRLVDHYSENLRTTTGEAEKDLPTALNEAVGPWRISVTDAMTGRTHSATITIADR